MMFDYVSENKRILHKMQAKAQRSSEAWRDFLHLSLVDLSLLTHIVPILTLVIDFAKSFSSRAS